MKSKMIISAVALALLSASVICAADSTEENKRRSAREFLKLFRICTSFNPALRLPYRRPRDTPCSRTSERTCSW